MPEDLDRLRHIRESWDDNASAWTRAVREGRIASRLDGTNRAVIEAIRESEAQRLLDVGCGEGWLAHRMERDGCAVTGFDGSADLIASAQDGPGHFIHLDYGAFVKDPTLVGVDFDAAICNFSLFEEDLDALLRAVRRCLTPNGRLVIQTVHPFAGHNEPPYEDGWRSESFRSLDDGYRPMPWYFRTFGSWVDALRRAGYDLSRCYEPLSEQTGLPMSIVFSCVMRR